MKRRKYLIKLLLLILLSTIPNNIYSYTHDELSEMLLLNNPKLINLRKDIEIAKLDTKDAKAHFQPTIDLTITGTYMLNPPVGKIVVYPEDYISGESGTSGNLTPLSAIGLDGPLTVYQGMENTQYNFGLRLRQPLYTWGKIAKAVDIYNKAYTLKILQSNTTYNQLTNELEAREATLFYLFRIKEILKEQKEHTGELLTLINEAYLNELILELDVLEAEIQAKEIDLTINKIEKEIEIQLSNIQQLCNNPDITIDDIKYQFDETQITNILKIEIDTIIDTATSNNNETIQTLIILESLKKDELTLSKKDIYWKPDLALQIDASYSGPRFPLIETGYYTQNDAGLNVTVAITSTIWDGGTKLNDIKRKELNNSKATIDIVDAKTTIRQTIIESYEYLALSTKTIEYLNLKNEVLNKKIAKQQIEYEEGYLNKEDIIKTQLEKLTNEIEIMNEKLLQITHYFTISYLVNI